MAPYRFPNDSPRIPQWRPKKSGDDDDDADVLGGMPSDSLWIPRGFRKDSPRIPRWFRKDCVGGEDDDDELLGGIRRSFHTALLRCAWISAQGFS